MFMLWRDSTKIVHAHLFTLQMLQFRGHLSEVFACNLLLFACATRPEETRYATNRWNPASRSSYTDFSTNTQKPVFDTHLISMRNATRYHK